MVVYDTTEVKGITFGRARSDRNVYIMRGDQKYKVALFNVDKPREFVETDEPIAE